MSNETQQPQEDKVPLNVAFVLAFVGANTYQVGDVLIGYSPEKVGKRVLRSPCYCTNAEAAKLKSDKERLNKEIKKRDEKRWN